MIPFKEVLGQVKRTLREASPPEIQGLLAELTEARVLSRDYCLLLSQEWDSEDVARRISLPVWQNWDLCCGAIGAVLERARDSASASCQPSSNGAGMQEMTLDPLGFLEHISIEDFDDYAIFSPNPHDDLTEDGDLNDSIETLIRILSEEESLNGLTEPSLPEPASWEPPETSLESKRPEKKRERSHSASPSRGGAPRKRSRRGPAGSRVSKKTRGTESRSGQMAPSSPKTPNGPALPPPQGLLQTIHHLLPLSISTAFVNACEGATAIQLIPAVTYPQQVINISVPNPGPPTYVIVPQSHLPPVTHVMPQSPGTGAAVPSDFMVSTPGSSCLDSAFQASYPEQTPTPSPTRDTSPCKESPVQTPPSEPAPGKPKCAEDYTQSVKALMREIARKTDPENEMSVESQYIDVPLVQRQIRLKTGKNASKCLEKELVMLSDADSKRAVLHMGQLFEDMGQKGGRLIALLGKAGGGKTAFVQKLCLDWADGNLPQFEYIFVLDSKVLNLPHTTYSLRKLLFDLSSSPPCKNTTAIFKHVLSVPQKVLIVFDSFDDFRDPEGLLHSPATCNTKERFSVKQLFAGIFQKKLLRGCTLLILARPKGVFNQFLAKVDRIVELCGYSPENITLYISECFRDRGDKALEKLKKQRYLSSRCSNPLICRYMCFLLKHSERLPSTLTSLFQQVLDKKMHSDTQGEDSKMAQQRAHLSKLCCIAWAGVKNHNSILDQKDTAELKEFGLKCGLLTTYLTRAKDSEERQGHGFAHPLLQSFLAALHLVQSRDVSDKALVAQLTAPQKRRRLLTDWLEATWRFALGLLFQKGRVEATAAVVAKKAAAAMHLRGLKPGDLGPARLMELCHCVYEAADAAITRHLVRNLPEDLRFCGIQLSSPDVFVLQHLLQKARDMKRSFSIDLQDTGIGLQGLRDILGLKCVQSFRASIEDTINLWEDLQKKCEERLLQNTIRKFTISPLKATHLDHVDHLIMLVRIYRGGKISTGDLRSEPAVETTTFDVPAVRNLQKLELSLGPSNGPMGFTKLMEVLPALQWLQHLDLEDNKIGDRGAEELAAVLSALSSLEMLNLSQNCIGDKGLEKLAPALPSLVSLHSLSLYSNFICDGGAESLAKVLPDIQSLTDLDVKDNRFTNVGAQSLSHGLKNAPRMKTVRMWNHYIPHGVLEHLKQQDPRIRSL
ncbi:MHC class II transactivator isoform X1 [Paramormyrops kingsleyae]|uniref:MHC class II transactivator isoform X1 n=2 Tax=Paramormyrops kingsleyae TaxID=1676925 RepID=UPI003B96B28D